MKAVQFSTQGVDRHAGLVVDESVIDVSDLIESMAIDAGHARRYHDAGIPTYRSGWMRWLQAGPQARLAFRRSLDSRLVAAPRHALTSVQLHAPLARPGKIVAIGRNYADHAKETGVQPFEKPRIISKLPSSVCDPGATVPVPADVQKMDFEAELAVVIGSHAHAVSREDALQHVAA